MPVHVIRPRRRWSGILEVFIRTHKIYNRHIQLYRLMRTMGSMPWVFCIRDSMLYPEGARRISPSRISGGTSDEDTLIFKVPYLREREGRPLSHSARESGLLGKHLTKSWTCILHHINILPYFTAHKNPSCSTPISAASPALLGQSPVHIENEGEQT